MHVINILKFFLFKKGKFPKLCISARDVFLIVNSPVIPSDFYTRTKILTGIAQM